MFGQYIEFSQTLTAVSKTLIIVLILLSLNSYLKIPTKMIARFC